MHLHAQQWTSVLSWSRDSSKRSCQPSAPAVSVHESANLLRVLVCCVYSMHASAACVNDLSLNHYIDQVGNAILDEVEKNFLLFSLHASSLDYLSQASRSQWYTWDKELIVCTCNTQYTQAWKVFSLAKFNWLWQSRVASQQYHSCCYHRDDMYVLADKNKTLQPLPSCAC